MEPFNFHRLLIGCYCATEVQGGKKHGFFPKTLAHSDRYSWQNYNINHYKMTLPPMLKTWKQRKMELLTWPHVSLQAIAWLASWRNTVTSLNGISSIVLHNYTGKEIGNKIRNKVATKENITSLCYLVKGLFPYEERLGESNMLDALNYGMIG